MISSSVVTLIDPNPFLSQTFNSLDGNIIASFNISNSFNPQEDKVEVFIYDKNKKLVSQDYDYKGWSVEGKGLSTETNLAFLNLNPEKDLISYNFDKGELNILYSFIKNLLGSSIFNTFYIDEISSDRTEIKLKSNIISSDVLLNSFNELRNQQKDLDYFDEIYINFGENNYFIVLNYSLNNENQLLIKLYEPLPVGFNLKDELYIVSKPAESVVYNVKFVENVEIDDIIKIKGPNINFNLKDNLGITDIYRNYNDLTSTIVTSSFYKLQNVLNNNKSVNLSVDYTDFEDFIHFSSLEQRLINFYYKVSQIEGYQNEINVILAGIVSPTIDTYEVSSSLSNLKQSINDVISKFDGYEHYLYYESNSYSWPKSNTNPPYNLYSTGSVSASVWYGSDDPNSVYYGGQILSASLYDDSNQNNLIYLIPTYVRDSEESYPYIIYINMVGQFFDNLWIYTKGITEKLKADNRILDGVSRDLVADVLESFGTKLYTNNYSLLNLYSSLLGMDVSGSYYPPTGSELITNLIAVNSGSNYYPYNIDYINKEIYKRLYHNLPDLLKKKGTVGGLRELINIYGIPSTILNISEFGGNDKIKSQGNYWKDVFNYAYTSIGGGTTHAIRIPFIAHPTLNTTRPNTILFRFKTPTFFSNTSSISYSQSLFRQGRAAAEPTAKFSCVLEYTGSLATGSHSGSIVNPHYDWGFVKFILSGSSTVESASVYLPVFDGGWWSVMVNKDSSGINLYVKNKPYIGDDGNTIGYQASSSILTSDTGGWDIAGDGNILLRLGRSHTAINGITYDGFSGSMQEFRYYKNTLSESIFNNFVLNPLSIEENEISGSSTSYNMLSFRAPLGTDLVGTDAELRSGSLNFDVTCYDLKSMNPSITGSSPTASWAAGFGGGLIAGASRYLMPETGSFGTNWSFQPNIESIITKEANSGIKSKSSNKIKLEDLIIPLSSSQSVISNQRSIQQYPVFSGSYSNDLNTLEVAFSPQNEVNDDIIDQFGEFNIGEYISPQDISGSLTNYNQLNKLSEEYFKKYIHNYYFWDYIRLIKFFDNSLFKLLKDFVPAKTSLLSGLVIKQHLLERNKHPRVVVNISSSLAYISSSSIYKIENIYLTGSIKTIPGLTTDKQKTYTSSTDYSKIPIETVFGGTGGTMPNLLIETQSYNTYITQSWVGTNPYISGNVAFTHSTQDEFFNGEFSGSKYIVTTQSLNPECAPILKANDTDIYYRPYLFMSSTFSLENFLIAVPSGSNLFLYYDTGSTLEVPGTPVFGGG